MYRAFLILLSLSTVSLAQVKAPKIGFVRYEDNTVHLVSGVAAAFIVGQASLPSVDAASFGQAGSILSTHEKLSVTNADLQPVAEDDGGPGAVVGIDESLDTAIAWLPETSTIVRYNGTKMERTVLSAPVPGAVIAIRADGQNAELLVQSEGAVSALIISISNGNLVEQRFLSGVKNPAIYTGTSILFLDGNLLLLQSPDGARQTVPLNPRHGPVKLQAMSQNWVHISDSQTYWALDISRRPLRLFELPSSPAQVRQ